MLIAVEEKHSIVSFIINFSTLSFPMATFISHELCDLVRRVDIAYHDEVGRCDVTVDYAHD